MKFAKAVVKSRVLILIVAVILIVPAILGMVFTRVNYDLLNYLPEDLDTVKGQHYLMDEFGKGAFSFLIIEDMDNKDVVKIEDKIKKVNHVDTVLWYADVADLSVPIEMLPKKVYDAFNTDNATLMAIFFDSGTSSDETINAITEIRGIINEQCFLSGMSAMVADMRDLAENEEAIYVAIAVVLAVAVMMLFLDNFIIPFAFLASIGISILFNMGTNYFMGEISYITKALAAVLQLAVTMDYSIFLWHSYEEQKLLNSDHKNAMAVAIKETVRSVLGSSITTIAGFIALCFMSFSLGRDLGIVMAKGVMLGVLSCVTILPAIILVLDKPLSKTMHRSLIPDTKKFAKGIVKIFPVFLILFVLIIAPALYGYGQTNNEVYYNFSQSLPADMDNVIANTKLEEDFGVGTTHMALINSKLDNKDVHNMLSEMEKVKGVKYVLGLESLI
ncbi:MAG: MMPL family transporter, partial [Ruminococcus sp.]|nr:MMPL family transporter [Ruminococcus sp.]